jgi:uncharacterized membrane protein YfcA
MLTEGQMIAAAVIETGAGVVQGALGFGINTLAVPLLVLLSFGFVPVPVIIASMLGAALVIWRERPFPGLGTVRWAVVGRVPGNAIGVALLAVLSARVAALTMACMVLTAVGASRLSAKLPHNVTTMFTTGVISGVMGTVAGLGGVPLGLVHQGAAGTRLRRTMSAYVLIGGALSLITLALGGRFGGAQLVPTLVLLPGVVMGYFLSSRVLRFVDSRVRPIVLVVAAAASVGVIVTRLW